jgi:hypothetical protein
MKISDVIFAPFTFLSANNLTLTTFEILCPRGGLQLMMKEKTLKLPEIEFRLYVRIESLTWLAYPESFTVLALSGTTN